MCKERDGDVAIPIPIKCMVSEEGRVWWSNFLVVTRKGEGDNSHCEEESNYLFKDMQQIPWKMESTTFDDQENPIMRASP